MRIIRRQLLHFIKPNPPSPFFRPPHPTLTLALALAQILTILTTPRPYLTPAPTPTPTITDIPILLLNTNTNRLDPSPHHRQRQRREDALRKHTRSLPHRLKQMRILIWQHHHRCSSSRRIKVDMMRRRLGLH
jgi:hypothetical protein